MHILERHADEGQLKRALSISVRRSVTSNCSHCVQDGSKRQQKSAPVTQHIKAVDTAHLVVARPGEHPKLIAMYRCIVSGCQLGWNHSPEHAST